MNYCLNKRNSRIRNKKKRDTKRFSCSISASSFLMEASAIFPSSKHQQVLSPKISTVFFSHAISPRLLEEANKINCLNIPPKKVQKAIRVSGERKEVESKQSVHWKNSKCNVNCDYEDKILLISTELVPEFKLINYYKFNAAKYTCFIDILTSFDWNLKESSS